MELKGKKTLITGAGRGMGKAIALAFAKEGADLVAADLKIEALEDTVKEASAFGVTVHPLAWDVSDIGGIEAKLKEGVELLGGIDILVNNAGVLYKPDVTEEENWDFVMTINLKAVFFICKAAGEIMKTQNGGTIINMASDAGMRPAKDPYSLSKWGVVGLTQGFARDLAKHGIRVNAISPGPVATAMMGCEDGKPREDAGLPLGRFSTADEIADVAVALASQRTRALAGQVIAVNSADA